MKMVESYTDSYVGDPVTDRQLLLRFAKCNKILITDLKKISTNSKRKLIERWSPKRIEF